MDNRKTLFISDLHVGLKRPWSWFQHDHHMDRLLAFLDFVAHEDAVQTLVLLGDTFDNWIWPPDIEPVSLHAIATAPDNKPIVGALQAVAARGKQVIYVQGNHDQESNAALIEDALPGVSFVGERYDARPIYAEHGHAYGLFNAPDLHRRRALGYFVARMVTRKDGTGVNEKSILPKLLGELAHSIFSSERFPAAVIESVAEAARMNGQDTIMLPGGSQVAVDRVASGYGNLFKEWEHRKGTLWAARMVEGDLNNLSWFAESVGKRHHYQAVVMGHTHEAVFDRRKAGDGLVYVNSGTWKDKGAPTFVQVEPRSEGLWVSLQAWEPAGARFQTRLLDELKLKRADAK